MHLTSGAGFGLSLILNIEQYEYMKGPQDEAGIKMLLHDSLDIPLVKELGFAIAPGTHTLVGVNREKVRSISHKSIVWMPIWLTEIGVLTIHSILGTEIVSAFKVKMFPHSEGDEVTTIQMCLLE